MSVDVEIYMNGILKFFRENPNDLLNLVPKTKEEEFYKKIKEVALENYEKGEEVSLTQPQLIDVCVEINKPKAKKIEKSVNHLFVQTKFGEYCLN
jgi:hypothetical protein